MSQNKTFITKKTFLFASALSTTKAATSTFGIPEVPQSSTVFPAQPHSALISPSTSTEPGTSSSLEGPKVVSFYTKPEMTTSPPKTDPKGDFNIKFMQ